MSARPKSCPSCGESEHLVEGDDSTHTWVACAGCGWDLYEKKPERQSGPRPTPEQSARNRDWAQRIMRWGR